MVSWIIILNLNLMLLCVYVCVCVCACEQSSKLADNIEQKIMNNKLFKTTSRNV